MADWDSFSIKVAELRVKQALNAAKVQNAFRYAAENGVSDQRLAQLFTKFRGWTAGTLGLKRETKTGMPLSGSAVRRGAFPRAAPTPESIGDTPTRWREYDALEALEKKLHPASQQEWHEVLPGGHTYGSNASNELRETFGLGRLHGVDEDLSTMMGWQGKYHPSVASELPPWPKPKVAPGATPPPPGATPPPPGRRFKRPPGWVTGAGLFGTGALGGYAGGRATMSDAPTPLARSPRPQEQMSFRKHNARQIGQRIKDVLGDSWQRLQARYGGAK